MENEKTKKILIILAIIAIIASIIGTILLMNATTPTTEYYDEERGTQTGTISLSVKEEPQEHTSSGSISLNIVNNE